MINEKASTRQALSYKRQFVGLTDGNRSRNFVVFHPRKRHVWVGFPRLSEAAKWADRLEDAGLEAAVRGNGALRVAVNEGALRDHGPILRELFQTAVAEYQEDA